MSASHPSLWPRPSWVTNGVVRFTATRVDLDDEDESLPRLPSDDDMAPPTGQLPYAPFFIGGALSSYRRHMIGPEYYVRTAYKFWVVPETLPSRTNPKWVFTHTCQSIYPRAANVTSSPTGSIHSEFWLSWSQFYPGIWTLLEEEKARFVLREDCIKQDGTHKLFGRSKLEWRDPKDKLLSVVMWTPESAYIESAMRGDTNYQPMVPGPTVDQLRQWYDINKTISAYADDDDDDNGDGENGE